MGRQDAQARPVTVSAGHGHHGACYPGSIITDDAAPLQPIERKPTPFNVVPCCYRVSGAYSARCNRFCGSVSVWAEFPPPFSAAHMADLAPLRRGFSVAGHCATNGAARRWMVGLLCLRRDRQALCNHEDPNLAPLRRGFLCARGWCSVGMPTQKPSARLAVNFCLPGQVRGVGSTTTPLCEKSTARPAASPPRMPLTRGAPRCVTNCAARCCGGLAAMLLALQTCKPHLVGR